MASYSEANLEMYEQYAEKFDAANGTYLLRHLVPDAEFFIQNLPGKRIIDLGSGGGSHSTFFKERGLEPLCVDFSPAMVRLCKQKGLEAEVGDMEDLQFDDNSFEGIWACASLLHLPKRNLPSVLDKINRILKPNGLLFVGVKEGEHEGWLESDKYPGSVRWFSYYKEDELRQLLNGYLDIIREGKTNPSFGIFLNYICRKR